MNFTDAVRELEEGRCEEIEKDGIFFRIHKGTLRCAFTSGGEIDSTFFFRPRFYLADDFKLVGEKPQMEDVEVARWLHKVEDRLMPEGFTPEDELGFVKLAGIDQRPVPRKVKQRKLLDRHSPNSCWYIREGGYTVKVPTDRPVYVEWEEEAPK